MTKIDVLIETARPESDSHTSNNINGNGIADNGPQVRRSHKRRPIVRPTVAETFCTAIVKRYAADCRGACILGDEKINVFLHVL